MADKKIKVEPADEESEEVDTIKDLKYEDKLKFASVIAKPMAPKKLCKKIVKLLRKASAEKGQVAFGIKNVQTAIRKGSTGLVILAGDVTPIDIITHLPTWCEEKDIPYIYVPTKYDIGEGLGKNACIMALVKEGQSYSSAYDEAVNEVKFIPVPL